MAKRLFDLVFAATAVVVTLPLMALAALLVRFSSTGPILFRQKRVGRNFEPFEILKFRTMFASAGTRGGSITAGNDPRVTRIGWWLRMSKVDELPQLFNVLRGEMSIVGPRPEVDEYVQMFRDDYKDILSVRPGVTDLASVRFRDEEQVLASARDPMAYYVSKVLPLKIALAKEYLKRQSILLDIGIVIRTIAQVFLKGGSTDLDEQRVPAQAQSRASVYAVRAVTLAVQLAIIGLSNYLAFLLRFDGNLPGWALRSFLVMVSSLIVIRGLVFIPFRLYEGLWRYTSVYDLLGLVGGIGTSGLIFLALTQMFLGPALYPRSVVLIDGVLATALLGGIRVARRLYAEMMQAPAPSRRILVYGAGTFGEQAVREMRQNRSLGYRPVGFIDDDPSKTGQRIHGVPVLGTRDDLSAIINRCTPSAVLVATPGVRPEVLRTILDTLEPFDIAIKLLPNLRDIMERETDGEAHVDQMRSLAVEDLLARAPIGLDERPVRRLVEGRHVMVTGAGGSIGSELCRQILKLRPSRLVLFERHENSLHAIRLELEEHRDGAAIHAVIGDVADASSVESVFKKHRPEIVFHAAAHKHVPLMEENPCEAVKNNVRGTRILARAATAHRVDRFVFISTDKAANPTSIMGASKRICELLVQAEAAASATSFAIVRFGNVLGSSGSVVPRFLDQIRRGGPVTVTHPEVRRFFMLIPEAVQLVLHAAAHAQTSSTYVLEMGEQIKLVDMARNLIRLAGRVPDEDIKIRFIGLRPGEKLEEELIGSDEKLEPSEVDKIWHVVDGRPRSENLAARIQCLEERAQTGDNAAVLESLRALVSIPAPEAEETAVSSSAGAPPPVDFLVRNRRCPKCGSTSTRRARAVGVKERVRKKLGSERPYACDTCGARWWGDPGAVAHAISIGPSLHPDLTKLDVEMESMTSVRQRRHSSRRPS